MKETDNNAELNALENDLSSFLKPVRPSKQYITKMRDRIHFQPTMELRNPLAENRKLLYTLGGVLTGSLLLITVARAFFFLFRHDKA